MKKTFFLSIIFTILFSGCFSLNPFSDTKEEPKKEIEIPSDAPTWLIERRVKNNITAIGMSKNVNKEEFTSYKEKAFLGASHNLARKIYIKTFKLYKEYAEKDGHTNVFEKDIQEVAKKISMKTLAYAKLKNIWLSKEKNLYVQIGLDSNTLAEQIQLSSKELFEVNQNLYHNFLSNRVKANIIKFLEDGSLEQ